MTNITPRGHVRRCPAHVQSIASQVRSAHLEGSRMNPNEAVAALRVLHCADCTSLLGRKPMLDEDLMQSNLPQAAFDDPRYWYTVPGLLKLVENSGYRSTDQVQPWLMPLPSRFFGHEGASVCSPKAWL